MVTVSTVRFRKWHALRNDFILFLPGEVSDEAGAADIARRVCDRREGVGADGSIILSHAGAGRVRARIFNADGSEAEVSGNGFRCAAAALAREAGGANVPVVLIGAAGRSVHEILGEEGGGFKITSRFPGPKFDPADLPADVGRHDSMRFPVSVTGKTIHVSCVSVGNPHAVVLDGWDRSSWEAIGRDVECCEAFPKRVNVEFVKILSHERIEVYVWERGVGRTESSGTGAVASFCVARRKELVGDRVRVILEGGELFVEESGDGIAVTGTCAEVCRGTIDISGPERSP